MRVVLIAVVLLLSACATSSTATTTTGIPDGTGASLTAPTTTTTLLPSATATTPLPIAAVFLAVVEEAIEGTELEGFVEEDPESVLAIGQLFCELSERGLSDEDALEAYLEGVATQQDLTEDDATFAGVVFGAAERTLCPTTE
ncbi:MAG: hypothetical protein JSV07_08050 [Acidimicrobiia bacterium]|jgi:hypothetical protein|nr:MAG: hypothetical protein JSV07_08050 [Acidimicrobiia bacterium]